jgi:hypothetical protein
MPIKVILTTLSAALLLLSCDSPEVKRTRGGGPGADLGHRGQTVEMHAGSEPYHGTPQLIDSGHAFIGSETKRQQEQANRQ